MEAPRAASMSSASLSRAASADQRSLAAPACSGACSRQPTCLSTDFTSEARGPSAPARAAERMPTIASRTSRREKNRSDPRRENAIPAADRAASNSADWELVR